MSGESSAHVNRGRTFKRNARLNAVIAFAVLVLLSFGVSGLNWSVDLTANKRFSVNPATVEILRSVKSPLHVRFLISEERPADMAALENDMSNRLAAIAKAAGPEAMIFDPAKHVVRIANTAEWRKENAGLGVKEIRVQTSSGSASYIANLEISHESLDAAKQISVTRPDAMEYRLALAAVRIRDIPPKPPTIEEQIAAIDRNFTITYFSSGAAQPSEGETRSPLPKEVGNLRKHVREVLDLMAKHSNGKLTIQEVDVYGRRDLWDPEDMARVESSRGVVGYYSNIFVADESNAPRRIPRVQNADFVAKNVLREIWQMMQPRKKIGVYARGARPEYNAAEAALYGFNTDTPASAEQVVSLYLSNRLGYEVVAVQPHTTIATQDIAALVVIRPSDLSERELYDLSAYLAGGGRVMLLHSTWHMPLIDTNLRATRFENSSKTRWLKGDASGEIEARRLSKTLEGYLRNLGVSSEGSLLVSGGEGLQASVFGPPLAGGENLYDPPQSHKVLAPLVPFTRSEEGGHILASEIPALPLTGGARFTIDSEQAKLMGMEVTTLLRATAATGWISTKNNVESLFFRYGGQEREAVEKRWSSDAVFHNAKGEPVVLMLEGQFPFDASVPPPPKSVDDENKYAPPGDDFTPSKGQLVVIGAPSLFEAAQVGSTYKAPWGRREASLLAPQSSVLETSRTRLLSNIVDSMVYGEALLDVRRSLLPSARRLKPWSPQSKLVWTLLIVGLVPSLVAAGGLVLAWRRSKRRSAYEVSMKTLGRSEADNGSDA